MQRIAIALTVLVLVGCGFFDRPSPPRPLAKNATLDVYIVADEATVETLTVEDPQSASDVQLLQPPLINSSDIRSIQPDPDHHALKVTLTPTGAAKLAAITANPTGMRLAILANGEVLSIPRVLDPISNQFMITGSGLKDSEKMYERLTHE